jgi:hypothetical protein
MMQPEYTVDLLNANDPYHRNIIRSKLTRNMDSTFKEVREELVMAMADLIPTHEHSTWQSPRQRGHSSYSMQSGKRSPFKRLFSA